MKRNSIAALAAGLAIAAVGVPSALAADPNNTQYGNPSQDLQSEDSQTPAKDTTQAQTQAPTQSQPEPTRNTAAVSTSTQDDLPLTGLDLGIALGVGAAAVAGGLMLRRAGRKPTDQ